MHAGQLCQISFKSSLIASLVLPRAENQKPPTKITMKTIVAFAALLAVAAAGLLPQKGNEVVVVKETLHDNIGLSGYKYDYQLSDGQARDESAQVETRGAEDATLRVRGSFSFVAADGQTYTVNYVADENGFQPEGAHLPVAPVA